MRDKLAQAVSHLELASQSNTVAVQTLSNDQLVSKLYFFPGMRGFIRQPWGDGWTLVGDAGYMTDPITAHGIANALRDAELPARAIVDGADLAEYQTARDDPSLEFFEVSDRVASLGWDIPTVQQYHRMMSTAMGREEDALVAMREPSATAA